VTKDSLEITPVTTVARVSEALRLLHFQFGKLRLNSTQTQSAGSTGQNNYQATVSHLNELYTELVAPVRSKLTTTNLVIVPHGLLHYLPFHALHDGAAFLLDSYSISYSPSAAIHALCHATAGGAAAAGSLVLGVSDAQAPLIKDEVESIHRALHGSELFLGEAVTHQLLADKAKSCQIVHIATHGVFRPDNPMFSGIRLGDGYLNLYELYQMNLGVELLTLSGCATGLNVVAAGDELLGLIRGALYAGAKSLLLTLWDVNDHSTAEFMKSFYGHLPEAASKAEALSAAAKEVRENHPHPYYWAPFMLVGKRLSMN
jgi:CHAT domain-containing protein